MLVTFTKNEAAISLTGTSLSHLYFLANYKVYMCTLLMQFMPSHMKH